MLYESKCNECGEIHQYIASIAKCLSAAPMCCGHKTTRFFSANSIPEINKSSARVFENYKCPETGDVVTSDKQRNEIMAKHDLVDSREMGSGKEHIKRSNKIQADKDAIRDDNVSVDWTDLQTT